MISLCGGAPPLGTKPSNDENGMPNAYRILVPYKFKWRESVGKFTCDCKEVEEWYEPWYGFTWSHSKGCILMKQIRLKETRFGWMDVGIIAQSE